ncbi:MAG: hypothetical protein GY711_32290 [bacterium]|nr:hypothetical protein [bacterium]
MIQDLATITTRGASGVLFLLAVGCASGLKTPRLGFELPARYNTPDGMTLAPDGNIYLSVPNLGDSTHPAKILRITPDQELEEVITLPVHPELKTVGPMGITCAPDGHLYVADCQVFTDDNRKSRVLRVRMDEGRAIGCDVVVEGLVMANAMHYHEGALYVTESIIDKSAHPLPSGVYRFELSELSGDPVRVGGIGDPHLMATMYTENKEFPFGANGLSFDSEGRLYVCNFGDRQVLRFTLDAAGRVSAQEVFASDSGMESTDGLYITADDRIYVADFLGNAVHQIDIDSGRVNTLARSPVGDGAAGLLDGPSEVCVRGDRMYVSNIDLSFGDIQHDDVHNISVIDLVP